MYTKTASETVERCVRNNAAKVIVIHSSTREGGHLAGAGVGFVGYTISSEFRHMYIRGVKSVTNFLVYQKYTDTDLIFGISGIRILLFSWYSSMHFLILR